MESDKNDAAKADPPADSVPVVADVVDAPIAPLSPLDRLRVEYGYVFTPEGVLVEAATGHRFKFDVFGNDYEANQARYVSICDLVLEVIEDSLVRDYSCTRVRVPLGAADNQPYSNIYVSEDFYKNDAKLLVIIQGSGAVRPGVWARSVVINQDLATGSMFPYLTRAANEGYAYIILNPNQKRGTGECAGEKIPGSENPAAHTMYVWKNIISKSPANRVDFVAHSFGGVCTMELLAKMERSSDFRRIGKVALTDSAHSDDSYPLSIRKWLAKNAVNFERSTEKLGVILNKPTDGCLSVSAGHPKHEFTSGVAIDSVFKYLTGHPEFTVQRR